MMRWFIFAALFFILPTPALPAAGNCHRTSAITTLSCSDMSAFMDVAPLDFSRIRSAAAQRSKDGRKIEVFLSNGNFSVEQMANGYVLPLKNKKEFILVITFSNGPSPVTAGSYGPGAGYGKAFWSFMEVRVLSGPQGTNVSFGVNDGGAVIVELQPGNICGTFQLRRRNNTNILASASGTFNVPLTTARY